jgi:hypothetical protein
MATIADLTATVNGLAKAVEALPSEVTDTSVDQPELDEPVAEIQRAVAALVALRHE